MLFLVQLVFFTNQERVNEWLLPSFAGADPEFLKWGAKKWEEQRHAPYLFDHTPTNVYVRIVFAI